MLLLGLVLTVCAVVGLWRLPDVYLRYKAVAMVGSLAAVLVHVASALLVPAEYGARGFLTALLFLLSGPVLGQAVLLAAHNRGVDKVHTVDELSDALERGEGPKFED
jgi:monovalent cation/proton antiporter MnhG/PhaG subunit